MAHAKTKDRRGPIEAVPENGETGADVSNSVGGQSRGLPSNANLWSYGIGIILALFERGDQGNAAVSIGGTPVHKDSFFSDV